QRVCTIVLSTQAARRAEIMVKGSTFEKHLQERGITRISDYAWMLMSFQLRLLERRIITLGYNIIKCNLFTHKRPKKLGDERETVGTDFPVMILLRPYVNEQVWEWTTAINI